MVYGDLGAFSQAINSSACVFMFGGLGMHVFLWRIWAKGVE